MTPWLKLKKTTLLTMSLTALGAIAAQPGLASGGRISDSLVKDLDCRNLSTETVLASLQPDAFSAARHNPIRNWAANSLGQCWSLTHTQRQIFYFGRFGEAMPTGSAKTKEITLALDAIRGAHPYVANSDSMLIGQPPETQELPLNDMKPFAIPETQLSRGSEFLMALIKGISADDSATKTARGFKSEIEFFQMHRFGSPANLGMITGDRERSEGENQSTMNQIRNDLKRNRIVMLNIRAGRTTQHVVGIKNIVREDSRYVHMAVYDSNFPTNDNTLYYDKQARQFLAPNIIGAFRVSNPNGPVGAFIVDDDEMEDIEQSLVNYYSQKCSELGAGN